MIDIFIDKLTNSIQDRLTEETFETDVIEATFEELKNLKGWHFGWAKESHQYKIYKLIQRDMPSVIHGLISLEVQRGYVYVSLAESAPHNFGKNKQFLGVAGNLFAFACKIAYETGNGGFVSFVSKTALMKHYETTLGATSIGGQRMIIQPPASLNLINQYFKNS